MLRPSDLSVTTTGAGFLYEKVKDETSSGAGDGTNIESKISNNLWYALLAVLDHAGVTPSGSVEASDGSPVSGSGTNDFLDALVILINALLIDEDDMASDSEDYAPTQQSVKAFVENGGGFSPTAFVGGESTTLPNGMIMKMGTISCGGDSTAAVTFATAFPTACSYALVCLGEDFSTGTDAGAAVYGLSTTGLTVKNGVATTKVLNWQAIGY